MGKQIPETMGFKQIFLAPRRTGPGLEASLKRGLSWAERILWWHFWGPQKVSQSDILGAHLTCFDHIIVSFLVTYGTFQSWLPITCTVEFGSHPLNQWAAFSQQVPKKNGVKALQIPDGWNRIPAGQPQWYRKSSKRILNIGISQIGASQERVEFRTGKLMRLPFWNSILYVTNNFFHHPFSTTSATNLLINPRIWTSYPKHANRKNMEKCITTI